MSVIGIFTQTNNIIELENKIKKHNNNEKNIIVINEESIENMKNIKFDILIIFEEVEKNTQIRKLIKNSKVLIINTDFKENIKLLDEQGVYVITFGFNPKSTISIVSNENDEIILELQREIQSLNGEKIEYQEIKMSNNFGKKQIYFVISMKIMDFLTKYKVFM